MDILIDTDKDDNLETHTEIPELSVKSTDTGVDAVNRNR